MAQSSATQPDGAAEIARVPTLYYAPHNLQSFSCHVTPDWEGLAKQFGGTNTLADQSDLQFLKSIRLTAQDNLTQGGSVDWNIPDGIVPPPELAGRLPPLRQGLDRAFEVFFSFWNAVVTGDIFSQPADAGGITRDTTGWHTHEADASQSIDETFDRDLFLLSMKTVDSHGTRLVKPHFADTPDGRLVTSVELETTPAGSTATHAGRIGIGYSIVDGFHLPTTVSVLATGVSVEFTLTNCTAVKANQSTIPSGP